jgi:hypothetical protein
MRTALRPALVGVLVLVGLFGAYPSRAAACEDPWSCFNDPSDVGLGQAYVDYEGIGSAFHEWVDQTVTAIRDFVMQVPADGAAPGAPVEAGPTTGGNLFIFYWDWD